MQFKRMMRKVAEVLVSFSWTPNMFSPLTINSEAVCFIEFDEWSNSLSLFWALPLNLAKSENLCIRLFSTYLLNSWFFIIIILWINFRENNFCRAECSNGLALIIILIISARIFLILNATQFFFTGSKHLAIWSLIVRKLASVSLLTAA